MQDPAIKLWNFKNFVRGYCLEVESWAGFYARHYPRAANPSFRQSTSDVWDFAKMSQIYGWSGAGILGYHCGGCSQRLIQTEDGTPTTIDIYHSDPVMMKLPVAPIPFQACMFCGRRYHTLQEISQKVRALDRS